MIGLLFRSFLRFVVGAPFSSISVFVGVLLGVASVTGVHLLGAQINATLERLRPAHLTQVTHIATRNDLDVVAYGELLDRFHADELPGVTRLAPLVEGRMGDGTRVVGTDWLLAGRGFEPREAALKGDPVIVQAFAQAREGERRRIGGFDVQIVSVVESSELSVDQPTIFSDIGLAVDLLDMPGDRLQAVLIKAQSPEQKLKDALEFVMPGLSAGMPEVAVELGPQWQVHEVASEVGGFGLARAVLFNIGALGSLSLLVALLLMYQTCVIWLRRQREILERLNYIGVSRKSLATAFLMTLMALGMLAIGAGLLVGQWLAHGLLSQIAAGTTSVVSLGAGVIVKGLVAGLVVCILGGWVAWQIEWRPVVERVSWFAVGVAVSAMAASMVILRFTDGLIGVFAAILLIAGAVCWITFPVLNAGRALTNRLRGSLLVRLGLRESTWYAGDLALAVASLALALGVSIGVGLMVGSFRQEFVAMLQTRLQADVYVEAPTDISQAAAQLLERTDVKGVSLAGDSTLRVAGLPVSVGYTDFTAREAARFGLSRRLDVRQVLLSERGLRAFSVAPGEPLSVSGQTLTVVGSFAGFGDASVRMLMDVQTARLLGLPLRYNKLSIETPKPLELQTELASRYPTWQVSNQNSVRATAIEVFDQTFLVTEALTALAMIIAAVALFNALGGLRLNQQATSQLLDTLGLDRIDRLQVDLTRAFSVGTVALLLALPLGLWLGWVLCFEVNPRAFGWGIKLVMVPSAFAAPLASGLLAVLFAGLLGVPAESRERVT